MLYTTSRWPHLALTAALALLAERDPARARKDFAASDRLRDELAALGWQVRDGADGASLVRP